MLPLEEACLLSAVDARVEVDCWASASEVRESEWGRCELDPGPEPKECPERVLEVVDDGIRPPQTCADKLSSASCVVSCVWEMTRSVESSECSCLAEA